MRQSDLPDADELTHRSLDRRTLLLAATGALATAGLGQPARAAARAHLARRSPRSAFRPRAGPAAPARAARCPTRSERHRSGRDSARARPQARRLDRRGRPWPRVARRPDAQPRSVPGREHRQAIRLGGGAATCRARPTVPRRPASAGASGRCPPTLPDRSGHHRAHAARPSQWAAGMGQPLSTSRSRAIPRRSGAFPSSWIPLPRSPRSSRQGRGSSTPTRTTTSWG